MSDISQIIVFDRALVRRHRDRAAATFVTHDALFQETAFLLAERLGDVSRTFDVVLDLGARNGALTRLLEKENRFVVAADISHSLLGISAVPSVVADEEFLPFAPASFDLIVSNASLHWVNDLPGSLIQINRALRPDGLFLATILGGETLRELRVCMTDAELAVTGGISPRLSPVVDLPTASGLLQRAGFQLPVADQEIITLRYPDAFALMRDLRRMGESNAHTHRLRHPTRRAVLFEAAKLYYERFADSGGGVTASFEAIFLHGWKAAV